ncbi:metallophosphoesterase [Bosea sp. BH3]|uniref:metallophosphoesterase n=1 Tax=Bosea sp. BH3 TaxID=2871701 RepID=UPI0021CB9086|nr:metallophosphoesterase [Bosea sp. BH3]MCU4181742.1 metallophosphoesterase [Bosea sp. BH3]
MSSTNSVAMATSSDQMLSIPNAAQNQGLRVMPGGTGTATSYTLVYDLYVPAATSGGWIPFFQSAAGNTNDGDLFGRANDSNFGIGIGGNYQGEAQLDAWNRIAFTVEQKNNEVVITKYINGEMVGSQTSGDLGRYTIDKASGFLIFSDEDGETSPVHLSNFAYAETVLSAAEVAALGTANGAGIVSPVVNDTFAQANGSEFRFDDGTLGSSFGVATLQPVAITIPVETAAEAGITEIPAADQLMSLPATTREQTLKLTPGGTGVATEFTIAFDIFVPSDGNNGWIPFFQSSAANSNDGDLFGRVNGSSFGIGIGGNYQGEAQLDTWNRIAFTVEQDNGQVVINKYINGELVGTQTSTDLARYTIDKAAGFLIFSDEDGETSPVHISNIAYLEAVLSDAQMKAIGGPSAAGIVPSILEPDFIAANGTEFRFDDGSLEPTLGTGALDATNVEPVFQSPLEAGIPVVTAPPAPGGEEGEPIKLRSIADMMVTPDAETVVIELSQHFTQPGLTFTVTTSDGEAVGARLIDGNKLEIDAKAFGRSDIHVSAVDAEGQVYTDDFRVRVASESAYTIAVLPDTQDYTSPGLGQQTFNGMTQWLADNAGMLNLKFVTSVGDVTGGNSAGEWAIAKEAFEKLNGVVPYAMLPGNHDQAAGGSASNYTSMQSAYFGVEYMMEHSTLGGVYDQEADKTSNAWYTFEGEDGTKWIALSLEFGARDDVLRWAGEVLDAHSDYRAIVSTHHYTNMGTRADNYSGPLFAEGTGKDYGIGNSAENANDGEDMWQELIYSHTNVSFVFSGHVFGDGAETIVSYNEAGQPVYQMLVNYQNGVSLENTGNGDPSQGGNGGNGAIRLITIDPETGKVYTETYLSAYDEYITGSRGDAEPSRDGMGGEGSSGPQEVTQPVSFGTDTLPDGTSGVLNAPKFDPVNGLKVIPGFAPSDGGSTYGSYSLIYDVKLPESFGLSSIFQSDLNNITDGDLWLNHAGDHAVIGTNGQDEGFVPLGEYIRLAITLERVGEGGSTYIMSKYVNGVLQGTQTVGAAFNISQKGFLLFADDSGETLAFSLSSFAFVEKALTAAEVAALGGPTASGPFTSLIPGVNMAQFDFTNGNLNANLGSGTMSQQIGDGSGQQLTGDLREHEEEFDVDLGMPASQFRAEAGEHRTIAVGNAESTTISLDAGSSVDKLGQITDFEWLNADGEVVATGAEADVDLGVGVHWLTLKASAADGTVSTDMVRVTVTNADTLLSENFDDGNANGWTAPAARWQVAGSVQSRDTAVEGITAAEGLLRAYDGAAGIMSWSGTGSAAWTDYTVSATLTAEDQLGLGLVAYYQDAQNHYLLSFDISANKHQLIRVKDGVRTVLAEESATTPFDRAFAVEFAVSGGRLNATLDGEALFGGAVSDDAPLSGGSIGVYSAGQRQVFFDDILVQKGTLIADAGEAIRLIDFDGDGFVDIDLSALTSNGLTAGTTARWSENGELLASGSEATVKLGTGDHLLRLDIANAGGSAKDTVKVEIVAADKVLVHENFADGLAQGFRFVDEGELGTAAAWSVVDGVLKQTSNRYSRELGGTGDTAPSSQWSLNWSPLGDGIHALRKGTYAVYEGEGASEWTDYSVQTKFTSASGGGIGLLLHYQDANNYYKFELDNQTGLPQLFSLKDGIEQTLWQGPTRYDTAGSNTLRADIVGGKLQIWLNGVALFTRPIEIHDTEAGTFGLYNWRAGNGVTYDDVTVISLVETPPAGGPILGTAGDDELTGTAGDDIILAAAGDDEVSGGAGDDTVEGGEGDDELRGEAGDDLLKGGADDDALFGGVGNDVLIGGADDDLLDGGDGIDTADYSGDTAGVTVNLAEGYAEGDEAGSDELVSIENVIGGAGDDTLIGDDGDNVFVGGLGHNVIDGGAGFDTLDLSAATGPVTVDFAGGKASGSGIGTNSFSNIEKLLFGAGNDVVTGGNGAENLDGGAGNDTLKGGAGNDTLAGGEGDDTLDGGSGDDVVTGGIGNDTIKAGSGDDRIEGGEGNDVVDAGSGDDIVLGGAGNDTIDGGSGDDRIVGGAGDDILTGGSGHDVFVFAAGFGKDIVTDFRTTGSSSDVLEFDTDVFADFAMAMDAADQVGGDVVFTVDADTTLTLKGVQLSSLAQDDFRFV